MKKTALYLRVSTREQKVTNQERELRAVAKRHGWNITHVFRDEGISGTKGREERPGLQALMTAVAQRHIDLVAAWSIDRLGRSLVHVVNLMSELNAKQVGLYLHQQGVDSSTPSGAAMLQMCGVFAQFEVAVTRERIKAGLARARSEGKRLGRPRISPEVERRISEVRRAGNGIRKTAQLVGCGVSVVQRLERPARTKRRRAP